MIKLLIEEIASEKESENAMSTTEGHPKKSSISYITHNGIETLLWHQWKLSPNLLMTFASPYERSHPEVS
jgi:hypothetical protein